MKYTIEEARKVLGKSYSRTIAGVTYTYRLTHLLLDVSTSEQEYVFFAILYTFDATGHIIEQSQSTYYAEYMMNEIKNGNLK